MMRSDQQLCRIASEESFAVPADVARGLLHPELLVNQNQAAEIRSISCHDFLVNQNPKLYPDRFRCLVNQNPRSVDPQM